MELVAAILVLIGMTIVAGYYFNKNPEKVAKFGKKVFAGNIAVFVFLMVAALFVFFPSQAFAAETVATTAKTLETGSGIALLGAALSTGLACIGAGIAVAMVGAAAMGAMSEKPEMFGKSLAFVGLSEGIAIYGMIISIMILGKL